MLEKIIEDHTIPKNIKFATGVKNGLLNGKESQAVRAATAISALVEMGNESNIPFHARTLVWSIVSQLEKISVER